MKSIYNFLNLYSNDFMKIQLYFYLVLFVNLGINAQPELNLLGHVTYPDEMSDVWGYVDGSGREYALGLTQTGVSIVDVNDPTNPTELFFQSGPFTSWRDAKTWGNYAYVTNESSGGLLILDLGNLPASYSANVWMGGDYQGNTIDFTSSHNIFIDENGIGYVVGANYSVGGVIMIDLAANPIDPPIVGLWQSRYVHDVFVREEVMWTADIYAGLVSIVDIADKANPNVLNTIPTPDSFAHNTWLSDDSQYLFVTEEVSGAAISVYDVSNVLDVQMVDEFFSSTNSQVIPHNTFVKGNYIYNAHYRDGVTVADISDPTNVIEVANYDTSPAYASNGFNGCWGVYPYLPSGNILASDMENGLFVLGRAADQVNEVKVAPTVLLQGAMLSNGGGNLMRDDLRNKNLVPNNEPYTGLINFTHIGGGGETVSNTVLNKMGNDAIVDWVFVELRSADDPTQIVATQSALLQKDGQVKDTDGVSDLTFNVPPNNYYLAIRHRNHLGIMSENPLVLSGTTTEMDFTPSIQMTYGNYAQVLLTNGKRAMWAGNVNASNEVIFQGSNNDANAVFFKVLTAGNNGLNQVNYVYEGYHMEDVEMDGQVIYQGTNNEVNAIFFNVLTHPSNGSFLQNYIISEKLP